MLFNIRIFRVNIRCKKHKRIPCSFYASKSSRAFFQAWGWLPGDMGAPTPLAGGKGDATPTPDIGDEVEGADTTHWVRYSEA